MARHRGVFKPDEIAPYELSRSRIENFVRAQPASISNKSEGSSSPASLVSISTKLLTSCLSATLIKYRATQETHPFLESRGYGHLIPFQHDDFELWTQSLHFGAEGRMHYVHELTNLKVGGGLDDVWYNTETEQIHIVDYKSTSQKTEGKTISLDDPWKAAYKRHSIATLLPSTTTSRS
jgi:hypothetical protein